MGDTRKVGKIIVWGLFCIGGLVEYFKEDIIN